MPYTVPYSFQEYRSSVVDLDTDISKKARKSRDYLIDQIKSLANKDHFIPQLTSSTTKYIPFGSFARNTKVQPLDDVDLLLLLNGSNTTPFYLFGESYELSLKSNRYDLIFYINQRNFLNSTKILNKFKSALFSVPNYTKAEIKRSGVAVVLSLSSYDWVFDIVPAFSVSDGFGGTAYYLIPDGYGSWMKTDPRKDQNFVTDANKRHNGKLLPIIRLIKYWNTYRHSPPRLPSYYLETMLIRKSKFHKPYSTIRSELYHIFSDLKRSLLSPCPDPKGFGPDLSQSVDWEVREKVSEAAGKMASHVFRANKYEENGDNRAAINEWAKIFPNFPKYG